MKPEKLILWALGAVAAIWLLFNTLGGLGFKFDPFNLAEKGLNEAQIEEQLAKGEAAAARAQTGLTQDNSDIAARRRAADRATGDIHARNSEAIEKASGPDTPLSDELVSTINSGLCNYKSTPGCPSG